MNLFGEYKNLSLFLDNYILNLKTNPHAKRQRYTKNIIHKAQNGTFEMVSGRMHWCIDM